MITLRTALLVGSYVGTALVAGGLGWKLRDADYQKHLKQDAQTYEEVTSKFRQIEWQSEGISQQVRNILAKNSQANRETIRTVTERIPVYVTATPQEKQLVAGGGLPLGFVWSYNGAASLSSVPLPTGTDPGTPTGTDLSTLLRVTGGNFELCHQWRDELASWHLWYNQQAPLFNAPTSPEKPKE